MNKYSGKKIYQYQTSLRIRLSCGDISGALNANIYYRKPSGATGHWGAIIQDTTPSGHVYFDLSATGQLNESGEWRFWPKIGFLVGSAPGEAICVKVYKEGE